jgi:hypothetical protein
MGSARCRSADSGAARRSARARTGPVLQPLRDAVQPAGDQGEVAHAAVLLVRDQSGVLEHRELLDDRRQRDVKRFRELGHRRRTLGEALSDGAPRRVCQRREDGIKAVLLILHRSVKHSGLGARADPTCLTSMVKRASIAGGDRKEGLMARMMADCRRWPSDTHCSLVIIGEEDEVVQAAAEHAASVHGHDDNDEMRAQLRDFLEPADQYTPERQPEGALPG